MTSPVSFTIMKSNLSKLLLPLLFLLFSSWLMFHTVGYDSQEKNILLTRTVWSDFGSHIPLIRSFSMGDNFDRLLRLQSPEYPIFSGQPIRYHFLFYMVVGLLEKLGLRLDWALNLPSILGFTLLLAGIWSLAIALFKDTKVAILSIIFFLFNGSLSFIKFFNDHPLSLNTPLDITRANAFPAFGPWDGGLISAFWNLNIYTNQRHLALAFGIILLFIRWVTKASNISTHSSVTPAHSSVTPAKAGVQSNKKAFTHWIPAFAGMTLSSIFWGLIIGLFPWFHQPSLLVFAVLLTWYFIAFPRLRLPLLVTGGTALLLILPQLTSPFLSFARHPGLDPGSSSFLFWFPGYLIHDKLSIINFLSFWFANLGLHTILIPFGFFILPSRAKKILLPLFFLFILGNLFKFSMEVAANHKFFNFALILGNMISAYVIIRMRVPILVGILILSGLIDFFVIVNDTKGPLPDVGNNQTASWIAANTPKDAVFLNSSFLYHPASLAGRKIFLGWPYFAWSAGYDTYGRMAEMRTMYESKNPNVFCPLLKKHTISYVTVEDTKGDPNLPNIDVSYFLDNYKPAFEDADGKLRIYSFLVLCPPS